MVIRRAPSDRVPLEAELVDALPDALHPLLRHTHTHTRAHTHAHTHRETSHYINTITHCTQTHYFTHTRSSAVHTPLHIILYSHDKKYYAHASVHAKWPLVLLIIITPVYDNDNSNSNNYSYRNPFFFSFSCR